MYIILRKQTHKKWEDCTVRFEQNMISVSEGMDASEESDMLMSLKGMCLVNLLDMNKKVLCFFRT